MADVKVIWRPFPQQFMSYISSGDVWFEPTQRLELPEQILYGANVCDTCNLVQNKFLFMHHETYWLFLQASPQSQILKMDLTESLLKKCTYSDDFSFS